jgi:hypothetical protein
MNIFKCKKTIVTTLTVVMVVALAALPLAARERRGSMVEVTLIYGRLVSGELLAVKGHELIIHDQSRGQGFTVNIDEVSTIKIKKKSRALTGLVTGLVAGVVAGCVLSNLNGGGCPDCSLSPMLILITPCITTPIGSLTGAMLSSPKIMTTKDKKPAHIEECLRYLQKHARN